MHVLSAEPTSRRSLRRPTAEGLRRGCRKLFLQLLAVAHVPIPERHTDSRLGNRRQHIRGLVVFVSDPAPTVPTRRSRPNTTTTHRVTAAPVGERRSVFRQPPDPVEGLALLNRACGVFAFLGRACQVFAFLRRACGVFAFLGYAGHLFAFLSLACRVFAFLSYAGQLFAFLRRACGVFLFSGRACRLLAFLRRACAVFAFLSRTCRVLQLLGR